MVAQEASDKARYGHRRSLRVHLDTVHSLPSSWDLVSTIKVGSFTEDKRVIEIAIYRKITLPPSQYALEH